MPNFAAAASTQSASVSGDISFPSAFFAQDALAAVAPRSGLHCVQAERYNLT